MDRYLDIAREALRRRERERNAALQPGATVYWRSWDGVLRGPAVIEEVTQVDGVTWVYLTWDGCVHWVSARVVEDELPTPPEVTRRSPGPTRPVPDRCEVCAYRSSSDCQQSPQRGRNPRHRIIVELPDVLLEAGLGYRRDAPAFGEARSLEAGMAHRWA